ncbi:Exosome complex component Rrp41 [Halotydeus destructor]|nr:Exosome complex component Rrp41 [Halotydeus destructor]
MENSITIKLNNLTRADGSAIYAHGNSAFQVAVYGPADQPFHKELPDKALLDVYYKQSSYSKDSPPEVLEIEKFVKDSLEAALHLEFHPRSVISIIIQELEVDGCTFSSALNSAFAAMLDASIAMKFLIASVTTLVMQDTVTLDTTAENLQDSKADVTFVFENTSRKIITVHARGKISVAEFKQCRKIAKNEVDNVFSLYRTVMEKEILHH